MKIQAHTAISILKYKTEQLQKVEDVVAIEEPLEISLCFWRNAQLTRQSVSITMRTPSQDTELALGFLFTEAILQNQTQVKNIIQINENEIEIELQPDCNVDLSKLERHFYTSSSCGVCGKSSLDAVKTVHKQLAHLPNLTFPIEKLATLSDKVRAAQTVFESTGGLHASALFDRQGNLLRLAEDVGRHNALDKLIGSYFLENQLPLSQNVLFLSGRASFELIQKAAMAEIPIICALGAPSSLAVALAKEFQLTLIGFLKPHSFNVYCGEHRLA